MSHRKSAWLRAAVPAAVLALALTACGSDDEDEPSDAFGGSEQTEEATEAPADETTDAAEETTEEESEEGALTGQQPPAQAPSGGSFVTQDGPSEPLPFEDYDVSAQMQIAVERVDVGTSADLAGGLSDPSQAEGMKLASVYATFTHMGGDTLDNPFLMLDIDLLTADGRGASILTGSGYNNGCPELPYRDTYGFEEGESVTLCEVYAIPEDADPGQVVWTGDSLDPLATWNLTAG